MFHMLQIYFVGKSCDYMECQRRLPQTKMSSLVLLLEDLMPQARTQVTLLHGVPPSNRRQNRGDEPYTLHSTSRVDQEEHQGVGSMSTHHRVRLQSCKTFDYRQVPLRGRLRLQPVVTIGHSTSSSTRAHQHGCECTSKLHQEDA